MRLSLALISATYLAIAASAPVFDHDSGSPGVAVGFAAQAGQTPDTDPAPMSHLTRDLASILQPVASAVQPTTVGLGTGLQVAGAEVSSAASITGAAAGNIVNGLGTIGGNTVTGLGNTAPLLLPAVLHTIAILQNNSSLTPILNAIFGRSDVRRAQVTTGNVTPSDTSSLATYGLAH